MYEVRIGQVMVAEIAERWGPERSGSGRPSELDFWSGPLAAARLAFTDFDSLSYDLIPEVRSLQVIDVVFGPLLFTGVLVDRGLVELAGVTDDPDYWDLIEDDPDD